MAHLGRLYRRLFARDFSKRANFGWTYLANRYFTTDFGYAIFPGISFAQGTWKTGDPDIDYDAGSVTWDCIMPVGTSPRLACKLEWQLTFDEAFARGRETLSVDGVKRFYVEQLAQPESAFISCAGLVHVINGPPPPNHVTWGHTWAYLKWADE